MKLGTLALALAGMAQAHHSLDASYDLTREVKLEGKIFQILLRNPHSFLQIEAPDKDGNMERWALEWQSANSLGKQGIKSGTLKVGDKVTITMNPARKPPEARGALASLQRESDGLGWSESRRLRTAVH